MACQPCYSICSKLTDALKTILKFSNELQDLSLDPKQNVEINNLLLEQLSQMQQYAEEMSESSVPDQRKLIEEDIVELSQVIEKVVDSLDHDLKHQLKYSDKAKR